MSIQHCTIVSTSDKQLGKILDKLANIFGEFDATLTILNIPASEIRLPNPNNSAYLKAISLDSNLITSFHAKINDVIFSYNRNYIAETQSRSFIYDSLSINPQTSHPDEKTIETCALILKTFKPIPIPLPLSGNEHYNSLQTLQETIFTELTQQQINLHEQTIELNKKLHEQISEKYSELEAEFQKKHADYENEYQNRIQKLDEKEHALNERSKEIDESDNTFARRQIRDRMLKDVAERVKNFNLSETTINARNSVKKGMWGLIGLLGGLFVWSIYDIWQSNGSYSIFQIAKFASTSLFLSCSILYYIRWQNQWASSLASTEQALQQFHIDVNRANWVVETLLEWRKETDAEIPQALIEKLTHGLFHGIESPTPVLHPADELASALFGSASKLSLNLGGNTVEIDKPSSIPKVIPSKSPSNGS
ncbi:hypothetical protein V8J88_09495 [Massilia sp. W12]|uniref:hypothetical protein n=1 Tax=Massilia sp. W12 TaxID=3126507 RepID=UPI0030CC4576